MHEHTRVNPSQETIRIGPLEIRFLIAGEDSQGSVPVFEVRVPVGQKLAAPAHKNDAYEVILYGIQGLLTWTVDGSPSRSVRDRRCVSQEGRRIASIISVTRTPPNSRSFPRQSWDQPISERLRN